jgi:hypothetical protein
MYKNEIIHRERLTEAQVREVLQELRTNPDLRHDKWTVTVQRKSRVVCVEGPNKGKSEDGNILELVSKADASKTKTLWLTPGESFLK